MHTINPKYITTTFLLFSYLILNLTSDHLFNKTDNIKLALLSILLCVGTCIIATRPNHFKHIPAGLFCCLLLPAILSFPGSFFETGYDYSFLVAVVKKVAIALWATFIAYFLISGMSEKKLLQIIAPTLIIVCVFAFFEAGGLNPLWRFWLNPWDRLALGSAPGPGYTGWVLRVESTFGNPNYFAAALAQMTPLYTALLFSVRRNLQHSRTTRFLIATLIFMICACLLLTQTRSAILAAVVAMLVFFSGCYIFNIGDQKKQSKFNKTTVFLGTVAIITVLGIILKQINLIERFMQLGSSGPWVGRVMSWQTAWNSIQASPLWGYGLGSSYELFFHFHPAQLHLFTDEASFNHVHNEWLEMLQEGGLVAAVGYLTLWGGTFYLGIKQLRNPMLSSEIKMYLLAALSGLLAFQVHGLFSVAQQMIITNVYTATLFAIVYANLHLSTPRFSIKQHYIKIFGIFLCIGLILWGAITDLLPNYAYVKALKATRNGSTPDGMWTLADNSKHIYTLYEATKIAFEANDVERLQKYASLTNQIIPGYRSVEYYLAYAQWLSQSDNTLQAISALLHNDPFHLPTIILASKAALKYGDQSLFLQSLANHTQREACRNKIKDCSASPHVTIAPGAIIPIRFLLKKNELTVELSEGAWGLLKIQAKHSQADNQRQLVTQLMQASGSDTFFTPRTLEGTLVNSSTNIYHTLNLYLEKSELREKVNAKRSELVATVQSRTLLEEIDNYYKINVQFENEISGIDSDLQQLRSFLSHQIDIEEFLRRKKLLVDTGNWLYSSLSP